MDVGDPGILTNVDTPERYVELSQLDVSSSWRAGGSYGAAALQEARKRRGDVEVTRDFMICWFNSETLRRLKSENSECYGP